MDQSLESERRSSQPWERFFLKRAAPPKVVLFLHLFLATVRRSFGECEKSEQHHLRNRKGDHEINMHIMFISYRGGLSVSEPIFGHRLRILKMPVAAPARRQDQNSCAMNFRRAARQSRAARGFAGQGRSSEAHRCEVKWCKSITK